MTWAKNVRALLLALVAVAAVTALVALLVENTQTDRMWQQFVQKTSAEVETAEQSLAEATELADLGERVGVSAADVVSLRDQVEESRSLLDDLRGLEQYVVEDDVHTVSEESVQDPADEVLLDPYGTTDAAAVPLIVPPRPRTIMAEYSAVADDLEESLDQLAVLVEQVNLAIGSHTGELSEAVSLAREALTYQLIRGQLLMEYATNQYLPDDELTQLRQAVENGQDVQQEYRILDKNDPVLLAKALEVMESATEEIRNAVYGLVDKVQVDPDDLLDLINPDELWDDSQWDPPAAPEAGEDAATVTPPTAPAPAPAPVDPTNPETENPNPGTPEAETPETNLPQPEPGTGDAADEEPQMEPVTDA